MLSDWRPPGLLLPCCLLRHQVNMQQCNCLLRPGLNSLLAQLNCRVCGSHLLAISLASVSKRTGTSEAERSGSELL